MICFELDEALKGLEVYCVGGAVRDDLLGIAHDDRDWVVVGATSEDMLARGFRPVGRDFPVFLHPHTHEEYALARTERKSGHGYTGFVVHAAPDVTLEEDLARRDLTINAMAQDSAGRLVDPFQGADDCRAGTLRHVSQAFVEDPLRILRTGRFLARFRPRGFTVADETMALMKTMVAEGEVAHLVAERVWQEIERTLGEQDPAAFFELLQQCGALNVLMPALDDVLAAGLTRMSAAGTPMARWALLTADLSHEALMALCERYRVPGEWRDRALMVVRSRELLSDSPDAEQVLAWAQAMDAWRRQARMNEVLDILAIGDLGLPVAVLEHAVGQARQISPQSLMAQGYQGAELGRMIDVERRRAIEYALAQA
ncbi:CCA-adding enzyme [Kushneria pakistanensis]|uniref:CCA-adding enzyme n=1 Tax=Kushneria pakistanensis TaxID=1508770 RepID=A0ABQ3FAW2_9GAMM|nr:polynucleotide adenylyltransferase [Kushneria pakistanensis]GHC16452.1 CCA-adding enzyme [Kushneria pakistanensis]